MTRYKNNMTTIRTHLKISVILKSIICAIYAAILLNCYEFSVQAQTKWPNHQQARAHSATSQHQFNPNVYNNPELAGRGGSTTTRSQKVVFGHGNRRAISDQIGSTPSSIGKYERNQVAEWPFFKSLQSARNNYNADRYFDLLVDAKKSMENQMAARVTDLSGDKSGERRQSSLNAEINDMATSSSANDLSNQGPPTSPATPAGQTSTEGPAASSATDAGQEEPTRDVAEDEQEQPATTTTTAPPSTTSTASSTTSTTASTEPPTTTTTIAPSTTTTPTTTTSTTTTATARRTQEASSELPMGMSMSVAGTVDDQTPLFAPVIHSSIQQAVDRIVNKMAAANQLNNLTPKQPIVMADSGSNKPQLSLNVLLKHFGLHNLTDFDHLLLRQRNKNADNARSQEDDPDTIHLEIKPVKEGDCIGGKNKTVPATNEVGKSQLASPSLQPVEELATMVEVDKPTTDDNNHLPPSGLQMVPMSNLAPSSDSPGSAQSPQGRTLTRRPPVTHSHHAVPTESPRRKFVLKVQPEKELHPLNNRFKVSQSFDINSVPVGPSSYAAFSGITPGRRTASNVASSNKSSSQTPELCDGRQHYTTVGQLTTPEYPRYYPANIHCAFIIKRASSNYCKLMLQFRDFDLINERQQTSSLVDGACQNDYLQIGETRYCNRYAMIGHKMRLDFAEPTSNSTSEFTLIFHSDHMQSGRGFLIKYQQIPCDASENLQAGAKSLNSLAKAAPIDDVSGQRERQTVAPPLQQPDFSLALKTTPTTKPTQVTSSSKPGASSSAALTPMASTTSNLLSVSRPASHSVKSTSVRPEFVDSQPAKLATDCDQINDEMSFIIRSQNYPEPYGNNLDCVYYIRRNNSRVCYVELTFIKFDLEADADCRYDYLEVNTVRLCGSLKDLPHKTTRIYLFNEPIKVIKFRSDAIGAKSGFFIRADQLECASNGSILREPKSLLAGRRENHNQTRVRNETISDVLQNSLPESPLEPNRADFSSVAETPLSARRGASQTNSTIQYDSRPEQPKSTIEATAEFESARSTAPRPGQQLLGPRSSIESDPFVCNDVLYGKEVTIKSPHWPESYASDDSISTCKYTIIRRSIGKNKICQLELRFINLRLGVSDCIDINGYELLCGFNTRNLVKYYPFERQTHLTITFLSGGSFTKTGRSIGVQNHSDILPTKAPLRFMIIARQHECIDGFLSPQAELSPGYNQANLLYSLSPRFVNKTSSVNLRPELNSSNNSTNSRDSTLMYSFPNYTSNYNLSKTQPSAGGERANLELCPDQSLKLASDQLFTKNYPIDYMANSHCTVLVARKSPSICSLELELLDVDLDSDNICDSDYVQFNYGERYCNMEQVERRLGPKRLLLLPFNRADGYKVAILFHSNSFRSARGLLVRHRQVDCAELLQQPVISRQTELNSERKLIGRIPLISGPQHSDGQQQQELQPATSLPGSDPRKCSIQFGQYNGIFSSFNVLTNMRANFPTSSDCEIKFKLLPGYCNIQLAFSRFELSPRFNGNFCLEYLELEGQQYCGQELRNTTKYLRMTEPRIVTLRFSSTNSSNLYGFRAVAKQIECDPEPLRPLISGQTPTNAGSIGSKPAADSKDDARPQQQLPSLSEPARIASPSMPQVEFKEISIRSEFFELNSAKISKSISTYDANMFVVYRIKKVRPEVCKLRLMFYRFDLESSPGCKRDFMDIDNVDRLCGALGKPEDTRRDYDWAGERDLLISFVSDTNIQRDGFLLFGQQLDSCGSSAPLSNSGVGATSQTPSTTASPATSTTTQPTIPGATFDEEPANAPPPSQSSKGATTGEKTSAETNCSNIHYETSFELASPNWPQRYNSKAMCFYLIHKSQPDVCSVTFNVISMILDPDERDPISCDTSGSDHLDIDGQLLCGLISRPRAITVEFGSRQFITARFNSIAATGFGFFIEARQNKCRGNKDQQQSVPATMKPTVSASDSMVQSDSPRDVAKAPAPQSGSEPNPTSGGPGNCKQLLIGDINVIESENFPAPYGHNLDCLYAVRRTNQTVCAVDITLNYFELEEANPFSGNCENDYLEIDYSRFCGTYPANHQLRFNYFDSELDKFIKFHSDATNARAGYSLTISQVTSDCQAEGSTGSANTKSNGNESTRSTSEELINYLPDSSVASSSASRHPTLTEVTTGNSTTAKSSADVTSTLCQFVYHAERQYLLSPNYNEHRLNYDNNLDCLYKILARSYDICSLKLTLLDVDLEQSSGCHNDYILIDNKRYCDTNSTKEILLEFSETQPREIHLRYHTNGHVNSGRGFKILYEQVACDSSEPKTSSQANREARRSHFGQLTYPKNYVSVSVDAMQSRHESSQQEPQHRTRDMWNNNGPKLTPRGKSLHEGMQVDNAADLTIHKEIVVVKSSGNQPKMAMTTMR